MHVVHKLLPRVEWEKNVDKSNQKLFKTQNVDYNNFKTKRVEIVKSID